MGCDHKTGCVQCTDVPEFFGDDVFSATTGWTTRGYRVQFRLDGRYDTNDWPPEYAREIAKRLLDAADQAEKQTEGRRRTEPGYGL